MIERRVQGGGYGCGGGELEELDPNAGRSRTGQRKGLIMQQGDIEYTTQ